MAANLNSPPPLPGGGDEPQGADRYESMAGNGQEPESNAPPGAAETLKQLQEIDMQVHQFAATRPELKLAAQQAMAILKRATLGLLQSAGAAAGKPAGGGGGPRTASSPTGPTGA